MVQPKFQNQTSLKIMMKLSTNLRFDESRLGSVRTACSAVDIRRTLGQTQQECYVKSVISLSARKYMKPIANKLRTIYDICGH